MHSLTHSCFGVRSLPFTTPVAKKLGSTLVTRLFLLMLLILTFALGHEALEQRLDSGRPLPLVFTGEKGRTYKCIQISTNFGIQGHIMILIEVEGAHTMQEVYESLHVHDLGRSVTIFVTFHVHQPTKDYFIVASSHFTKPVLTATAILHHFGPKIPPSKPLPIGPNGHIHLFIKRARTIRLNLMANAARPNPQGSFHYEAIPNVRTLFPENTAAETKPRTYEKFTAETKPHPAEIKFFPAETGPCTHKKSPAETEHFPAEAKACTHKKSPAETEPFPAETKPCSHVVHFLPRNRRLLGKLPDVNVHSPPSTSNKKSWNLEKEDPPSPPAPSGNQPIHN